jgi:hypothetical protein
VNGVVLIVCKQFEMSFWSNINFRSLLEIIVMTLMEFVEHFIVKGICSCLQVANKENNSCDNF